MRQRVTVIARYIPSFIAAAIFLGGMIIIYLSAAGREVVNDDATWQYLSAVNELEYEENAATKPNAVEAEEAISVANRIESLPTAEVALAVVNNSKARVSSLRRYAALLQSEKISDESEIESTRDQMVRLLQEFERLRGEYFSRISHSGQ
jgi:hypothetical protein